MNEVELKVNSRTFRINFLQLENAVIGFFFEDRMRMGTVAIAMPGSREVAAGRSSVLVGGKYLMTSRALAERLAGKTGKIALISLFTELDETDALRIYVRLLDKLSATSPAEKAPRAEPSVRHNT